jgi:hypothetical protein
MIKDQTFETESVAPGSDQHVEEPVTNFVESLASYVNPLFTDPLILPLTDPPSTRFIDAYSSYILSPRSTTTQYFAMNPPLFGFTEGLGNFSFSTTHVVDTVGASLLGTSMTQVAQLNHLRIHLPSHMDQVIFLIHYFHTCTHQVLYLVVPSIRWPTINSFTQPQLHKLFILHLNHHR